MSTNGHGNKETHFAPTRWASWPDTLRAVVAGLLLTIPAISVWPLLLLKLGVPLAALAEAGFLGLFVWWTAGGGPPRSTAASRAIAFRRGRLTSAEWFWGLVAALCFAVTVHSSMVVLFRFVPFPAAAFHHGYDLSFIASRLMRWLAVLFSAMSAGVCEETGFRGYIQRPIEQRHRALIAILISSSFFTIVHLTSAWAIPGMIPIVFGAGVLLGLIAWSSGSLIPGIIGHVIMDVGLFAYWWTGLAGAFTARTIAVTGMDGAFVIAVTTFVSSLGIVLLAITKLRISLRARLRNSRAAHMPS